MCNSISTCVSPILIPFGLSCNGRTSASIPAASSVFCSIPERQLSGAAYICNPSGRRPPDGEMEPIWMAQPGLNASASCSAYSEPSPSPIIAIIWTRAVGNAGTSCSLIFRRCSGVMLRHSNCRWILTRAMRSSSADLFSRDASFSPAAARSLASPACLFASPAIVSADIVWLYEYESSRSESSSTRVLYGNAQNSRAIAMPNHTRELVFRSDLRLTVPLYAGKENANACPWMLKTALRPFHPGFQTNPSQCSIRCSATSQATTPTKNSIESHSRNLWTARAVSKESAENTYTMDLTRAILLSIIFCGRLYRYLKEDGK